MPCSQSPITVKAAIIMAAAGQGEYLGHKFVDCKYCIHGGVNIDSG